MTTGRINQVATLSERRSSHRTRPAQGPSGSRFTAVHMHPASGWECSGYLICCSCRSNNNRMEASTVQQSQKPCVTVDSPFPRFPVEPSSVLNQRYENNQSQPQRGEQTFSAGQSEALASHKPLDQPGGKELHAAGLAHL